MDWKQKLKTVAIVCFGAVLTACKKTAGEGPVERPQGVEATGNVQDALFENTANGDNVSEAQLTAIVNSQQGQTFSDNFREDLAHAGIYMGKKNKDGETLVLTSVDKVSHEENGHIVTSYENPKYGPNEIKSNVETINGMEVTHPEPKTYEADTLKVGIDHASDAEYVTREAQRARELLVDKKKLKGLSEGDVVSVGGVPAVVKKDGKALKVKAEKTVKVTAEKHTLYLNYPRGKDVTK